VFFFTKTVHNQTSCWLLVGYRTGYIATALYFHTKRLKVDQQKKIFDMLCRTVNMSIKNLKALFFILYFHYFQTPKSFRPEMLEASFQCPQIEDS
jgi:hypothetical protein